MTHSIPAADALKYAAAILKECAGWSLDGIAGSMCDHDHEIETHAIDDTVITIAGLAAHYGEPNRYSDGRIVKTRKEIQFGLCTEHVWHPDPAQEEPRSWRSALPSDPDVPSPGIFEVSTDPATQTIHVRIARLTTG